MATRNLENESVRIAMNRGGDHTESLEENCLSDVMWAL